ncbi:hypothetical protein D3C72_1962930 [compost metagenome]
MNFIDNGILALLIAFDIGIAIRIWIRLTKIHNSRFAYCISISTWIAFGIHGKHSHRFRIRIEHLIGYTIVRDFILIEVSADIRDPSTKVRRRQFNGPDPMLSLSQVKALNQDS